jgi:CheY-like chemotaxis protein
MEKFNAILLIDDDPVANFINKRLLMKMNIAAEIKVVTNGEDGIKYLIDHCRETKNCPEVIFLDINMPVMDGFEFLNTYQALHFENRKDVSVGVLTTSSHPNDKEKMTKLGATAFLNKPLTCEKI